jgi:hypothetical protein
MITNKTKDLLLVFFDFGKHQSLIPAINLAVQSLRNFANAQNTIINIIKPKEKNND